MMYVDTGNVGFGPVCVGNIRDMETIPNIVVVDINKSVVERYLAPVAPFVCPVFAPLASVLEKCKSRPRSVGANRRVQDQETRVLIRI